MVSVSTINFNRINYYKKERKKNNNNRIITGERLSVVGYGRRYSSSNNTIANNTNKIIM